MDDRGLSPSYVWRYTALGFKLHALIYAEATEALCGVGVWRASDWRGTGDQSEYEIAASLAPCANCQRIIKGH